MRYYYRACNSTVKAKGGKSVTLESVSNTKMTVLELKQKVKEKLGVADMNNCKLTLGGRVLSNAHTLRGEGINSQRTLRLFDCSIQEDITLYVLFILCLKLFFFCLSTYHTHACVWCLCVLSGTCVR